MRFKRNDTESDIEAKELDAGLQKHEIFKISITGNLVSEYSSEKGGSSSFGYEGEMKAGFTLAEMTKKVNSGFELNNSFNQNYRDVIIRNTQILFVMNKRTENAEPLDKTHIKYKK